MRRNVWLVPTLAVAAFGVLAGPADAQAPPAAAAAAAAASDPAAARIASADPDGRRMAQLLDQWAQQSTHLRTLDVKIKRIDASSVWGDEKYEGRAFFKTPNKACLDFQKVVADAKGAEKTVPHERILCTGKEVWQYVAPNKQIFIYKLGRQQQKRALQEGPLPFLFNFRADEARKRYRMEFLKQGQGFFIVRIFPTLDIDKEAFSSALIKLDAKFLLPVQVYLIKPDGQSTQNYLLSEIKPNQEIPDINFEGRLDKTWKVVREGDDAPPAIGQAPTPGEPQRPARSGLPFRRPR